MRKRVEGYFVRSPFSDEEEGLMPEEPCTFTTSAETIFRATQGIQIRSSELQQFLDRHRDVVTEHVPGHLREAQRIPVPINLAREMGLC